MTNPREVQLKSRPVGWPTPDDFALVESAHVDLADGQVRVRNEVMSVDPYMRGRMSDAKSYAEPYALGEAMHGGAVGVVIESQRRRRRRRRPRAARSRLARGGRRRRLRRPRRRHVGGPGVRLPRRARHDRPHGIRRPDPRRADSRRATSSSCPAPPAPSAASSARSPRRWARAASSAAPARRRRSTTCWTTSASTPPSTTRTGASPTCCARPRPTASTSTSTTSAATTSRPRSVRSASAAASRSAARSRSTTTPRRRPGPRNLARLIQTRGTITGFLVGDHWDLAGEYAQRAAGWIADGTLTSRETFSDGIDHAVDAFLGVLRGENVGKMLVRL